MTLKTHLATNLVTKFLLILTVFFSSLTVQAADYKIDTKGMHAFIQFRVQHLGYSWLYGRFNRFSGHFSYDEAAPEKARIQLRIDTRSVDTNHAERDKHLRSDDFLSVEKFPEATFVSTRYIPGKDGKGVLKGDFTLRGITHPLEIAVESIGAGDDPWGGYRRGFQGSARFTMADYGILKDLGPASREVELILSIEGLRVDTK